jgi:hypothetical protein
MQRKAIPLIVSMFCPICLGEKKILAKTQLTCGEEITKTCTNCKGSGYIHKEYIHSEFENGK